MGGYGCCDNTQSTPPFQTIIHNFRLYLDFHSLRHTYISQIVNSGASVKVAQELARHSTPTLTIGRYAHVRIHDLSAALDGLPDTNGPRDDANKLRATGTDDMRIDPQQYPQQSGRETTQAGAETCDESNMHGKSDDERNPRDIANKRDTVRRNAAQSENGSSRIRTRDRGIMSPQLYH